MKVLVVEDEKQILAFVKKGLEEQGFIVDGSRHGDEGYELALRALRGMTALRDDPNDRPAEQALRIRLLAASALAAIRSTDALPALAELLEESPDPRVQVAAAQAILMIIESSRRQVFDRAESNGKEW